MTTPLHNSLEESYAELVNQREALNDMQHRLAEVGTTVTSKNRAVSVTLDGQGKVSEIKFLTSGYRSMAPTELGALLVSTIADARAAVNNQIAEILQEVMPGTVVLDALNGDFDVNSVMDKAIAEAAADQSFFDLGSESDRSGGSGTESMR